MIRLMAIFLAWSLVISVERLSAQNGYSLEFEDVFFLTVDTIPVNGSSTVFPANTIITKSFTVPSNMVLKINTGRIASSSSSWWVYLQIDGKTLAGSNAASTSQFTKDSFTVFTNDYSVWVSSGSMVKLTLRIGSTQAQIARGDFGWIGGALFRKVPK